MNQSSFVKSIGGQGQGPNEFSRPNEFFIQGDKIYVTQGFFSEIKTVNLDGEYLSSKTQINIQNPLEIYAAGDRFYVFSAKVDQTFTKLEFTLNRFENDQFTASSEIFKQQYPPGLGGPNYDFNIFNKKGEWLYSFKTKKISRNCLYHQGRVYNVTPIDEESLEQFIDVYRIMY
ncbi:MAG: 6-bladed beta-propeller [Candidatus Aminicenantes bacterium]|nr:6-bladed beta-propeller [Candidatus Aminicenantes bacterium]